MLKALGLAAALVVTAPAFAAPQPARSPPPARQQLRPPSINWSHVGAVEYGLKEGCLPALRSGRSVYSFIKLQFDRKPAAARANHISQFVTIQEDARACVVAAHQGDPAELHAKVLELLSDGGPKANFVAGPADHVGRGPVADRIEGYCLTLGAQKVQAMVSIYSRPGGPRLMVVLMKVVDGPCAG